MRCQTCRYFDPYDLREGNCRRFPPIPIKFHREDTDTHEPIGVFPSVTFEDWCGEHLERKS